MIPAPAKPRYRVAIIGGGPGGSACALTLAKLGVPDVLLIEAGDYAQFRIGESIPPEANHLLQTLGIAQDFLFEGHAPCYGSCSYWGSDKRGYNDTLMNPLGHGWHLERSRFNRFMAAQARLRGIELLTNARLASSSEAGGGFALQLTLGGTSQQRAASVHADFVVDASGTRAVFARQRGSRKVDMPPLVCLAMRFAPSGAGTGLTHLEAVEHGWWYGAHLPDASLLLGFYSAADIIRTHRLQRTENWMAWLTDAPNTAALTRNAAPLEDVVHSFPAPSYCLDRLHGDNWLAIGDAASAYDPVTSQGIVKSIANGIAAANVINEGAATAGFAQSVQDQYRQYLALRRTCYGWEQRWPESPFWRQFQLG